ncbi:hypothetical protein JCM8547_009292 [Rhodosporidiobolus lusitaniae]
MPRQTRSSRPAARPAPAPAQQTRGAHTACVPPPSFPPLSTSLASPPPAHHAPPPAPVAHAPAPSAGPGLFGQMASTAAGVAVGSTVGHGLSSMLFGGGGSSSAPVEAAPTQPVEQQTFQQARMGGACDVQAKDFVSCLNATSNDTASCQYYLDMLKQCQAAAAPY